MKHSQPAKASYFFHGGFVDLSEVIKGAFENCGEIISRSKDGIAEAWESITEKFSYDGFWSGLLFLPIYLCKLFFYFVRLVSSAIVTPLICFSITMLQISILLALFLTALIFIGIIILIDLIYCVSKAIASHCPNCQQKFTMPVYVCPSCGEEHDRLRPGYYGILNRECECGKKLPTTFLNGRQKLEAQCPHCEGNIKDGGLHASWCIPIVGGPDSGKTCYINMTMLSLEKNANSQYNLRFEYENNRLDEYEENANRLSHGYLPEKTQDMRLRYYQFALTPNNATKQQISLCDVAGELFDVNIGGNEMNNQAGFRFVNAFMLIIDPLSVPDYLNEVSKETDLSEYKGGKQRIDEMLDAFVRTLQNIFSVDGKAMLNTDVAVVFTKVDIPGLDQKIGESAVLKHSPNLNTKTRYETQNKLCEQFLREYNEENFLNNLKSRFKSIQFFACSALGHVKNGQPFEAQNVEEPFFWLINKKSKVIEKAIMRRNKC